MLDDVLEANLRRTSVGTALNFDSQQAAHIHARNLSLRLVFRVRLPVSCDPVSGIFRCRASGLHSQKLKVQFELVRKRGASRIPRSHLRTA